MAFQVTYALEIMSGMDSYGHSYMYTTTLFGIQRISHKVTEENWNSAAERKGNKLPERPSVSGEVLSVHSEAVCSHFCQYIETRIWDIWDVR